MPYPRELVLDKNTQERLISYVETELLNHYGERDKWMTRLLQWQRDYWAEPKTKRATFPFVGASTLVIPLTAIAVEAVHARTMTTLFGLDQLVSATPLSAPWADAARPVEKFLNRELLGEMKLGKRLNSAILECEKFGTGIAKAGYERIQKIAIRTLPDGTEVDFPVTIRDGAAVDSVAFGRFLMPFSATDPQNAPWCGEEHARTPYEVLQMEESGFFRSGTMERLEAWVSQNARNSTGVERKYQQSQEKLEDREPSWPNLIDWVEMWLGFNVDGGEYNREIVIHYHRPSRTLLSVRYNWHDDLHRPYRVGNYFPVEFRWTGIGICKQNEQFQKEVTTQHRQRLDNATLANMRMIKVSKLSGYGPNEPIFPGKMWFVDDMSHVDTMQLGEIYNSAYNNEQATVSYSEKRTGVNDLILGAQAVGTPGTATGDLARIQEGNKKFDYAFDNIKSFVHEVVVDTAVLIQQFGPRRIEYFDVAEGGDDVRRFFEMPPEYIRNGLLIELNTVGQQHNRVIDRQNWLSIATILQQYYTGMLQLAQFSGNTQLMQFIVNKGIVAGTEALQQILESFDVRNVDRITLSELLQQSTANGGGNGNQPAPVAGAGNRLLGPGGNGAAASPGAAPGVENFAAIISALAGNSANGNGGFPNRG